MRLAVVLPLVFLVCVGRAQAGNDWRTECGSYFDRGFESCILKFSGSASPEKIQAESGEFIRAYIANGVRLDSPILIVEVELSKEGDASLTLRDPMKRNASRTYALTRSQFEALREKVWALRFDGASLHGGIATPEPAPMNTVCVDAATARVDTVFDRHIGTAEMNYCSDEDAEFLDYLLSVAVSLEPACMAGVQTWPGDELRMCLSGRGHPDHEH